MNYYGTILIISKNPNEKITPISKTFQTKEFLGTDIGYLIYCKASKIWFVDHAYIEKLPRRRLSDAYMSTFLSFIYPMKDYKDLVKINDLMKEANREDDQYLYIYSGNTDQFEPRRNIKNFFNLSNHKPTLPDGLLYDTLNLYIPPLRQIQNKYRRKYNINKYSDHSPYLKLYRFFQSEIHLMCNSERLRGMPSNFYFNHKLLDYILPFMLPPR